jgi:hypothetical protein
LQKTEKPQTKPKTRNSDKYNGILARPETNLAQTSDDNDTTASGLYEAEVELTNYYNYNYVGVF